MAVTRSKKNTLVAKLTELFASAKGTVGATYTGLSVANLQELRAAARVGGDRPSARASVAGPDHAGDVVDELGGPQALFVPPSTAARLGSRPCPTR